MRYLVNLKLLGTLLLGWKEYIFSFIKKEEFYVLIKQFKTIFVFKIAVFPQAVEVVYR